MIVAWSGLIEFPPGMVVGDGLAYLKKIHDASLRMILLGP